MGGQPMVTAAQRETYKPLAFRLGISERILEEMNKSPDFIEVPIGEDSIKIAVGAKATSTYNTGTPPNDSPTVDD